MKQSEGVFTEERLNVGSVRKVTPPQLTLPEVYG